MTQKSLYDTQKMWATRYMPIEIIIYQHACAEDRKEPYKYDHHRVGRFGRIFSLSSD